MTTVRVMAYNILRGRHRLQLARVVRSMAPDVLVVSESPRQPVLWRWQCQRLSREWGLRYVAGGRTAGGNLLLTSPWVQAVSADAWCLAKPWFQPRRGIVTAQLRVGSVEFGVVGCHLSLAPRSRHREVEMVIEAAGDLRGPIVVAGDLNERPDGDCWARLQAAGFIDAGNTSGATFPANCPDRRIDALLVRGDAMIAEQQSPEVDPALLAAASDHRPVAAVLEIPVSPRRGSPASAPWRAVQGRARRR